MRIEKRLNREQLMILVLCALLLPTSNAHTQTRRKIEGQVSDKDNNKIAGVLVRVYRGETKLGEDRTKADGSYTVSFDIENRITIIRYDHSDWNPTVIRNMSGTRDNTINKVLSRKGDALSPDEQRELASTLERLYAIDRANGVSDGEFRAAYQETIEKAKLPNELLTWLTPDRNGSNFRDLNPKAQDITGVWAGTAISSGLGGVFPSSVSFTLNLNRRGNTIVGTVVFPQGSITIKSGSFERGRIRLELDTPQGPLRMTGTVQGGRIESGRIESGRSEDGWIFNSRTGGRWSAVKKP